MINKRIFQRTNNKSMLSWTSHQNYFTVTFILFMVTPMKNFADIVDPGNEKAIWRDAAIISHLYTENIDGEIYAMPLSANLQDEAIIEAISHNVLTDQQPERILWEMELIPQTKFFKLKNLESQKYLLGNSASGKAQLAEEAESNDFNAQWSIKVLTTEGDTVILNRGARNTHNDGEDWALTLIKGSDRTQHSLALTEFSESSPKNSLFRMSSRFLEAKLEPFDIIKETCLVYLDNGAPMDGFYTPSPNAPTEKGISRHFKVKLSGEKAHLYEFVDDLGFDPLADTLNERQETVLAQIKSTISGMRLIEEGEYEAESVFNAFIEQLSIAYNNDSAALLYFPGSWEAFREDSAAGRIVRQAKVLTDQNLGIRVTVYDRLSSAYSYAMLAVKIKNGVKQFVFVDPTDTSAPQKPL